MPSTHLSLHYHLVFSTKERRPIIAPQWRDQLHAYLGGAVRTINAVALIVGGTHDHVHLLVGLRATHAVADVMREIKGTSSEWVHKPLSVRDFGWQEGYGAFTISASKLPDVKENIAHQEMHHRKKTFQEEYLEFLQKHEVPYDEKYLW